MIHNNINFYCIKEGRNLFLNAESDDAVKHICKLKTYNFIAGLFARLFGCGFKRKIGEEYYTISKESFKMNYEEFDSKKEAKQQFDEFLKNVKNDFNTEKYESFASFAKSNLKKSFKNADIFEYIRRDDQNGLIQCIRNGLNPDYEFYKMQSLKGRCRSDLYVEMGIPNSCTWTIDTLARSRRSCQNIYSNEQNSFIINEHPTFEKYNLLCWAEKNNFKKLKDILNKFGATDQEGCRYYYTKSDQRAMSKDENWQTTKFKYKDNKMELINENL